MVRLRREHNRSAGPQARRLGSQNQGSGFAAFFIVLPDRRALTARPAVLITRQNCTLTKTHLRDDGGQRVGTVSFG